MTTDQCDINRFKKTVTSQLHTIPTGFHTPNCTPSLNLTN